MIILVQTVLFLQLIDIDILHGFIQSLTVDIPGNVDPVDGIIQFSISINEGSEFVVGGSAGTPLLASVEVTILEDDGEL